MPEPTLAEDLQGGKVKNVTPPDEGKSRGRGRPPKREGIQALQKSLEHFFAEVLSPMASIADEYDGEIIRTNAKRLSVAYAGLAESSPRFRRFLEAVMASGGAAGAAMFATAAVALPILHHHRIIELPPALGVPLGAGFLEAHEPEGNGDQGSNGSGASGGRTPAADTVA